MAGGELNWKVGLRIKAVFKDIFDGRLADATDKMNHHDNAETLFSDVFVRPVFFLVELFLQMNAAIGFVVIDAQ